MVISVRIRVFLVNFWVNDMTTWRDDAISGKPLPPNVNMNFIGLKADGTEVVLHRFTSGDALTDYTLDFGRAAG